MKRLCTVLFISLAAFFLPILSHAASEATFQRTLKVTGTPVVAIQAGSGNIHVSLGTSNRVTVVGNVHVPHWERSAEEEKAMQQFLQDPPVRQTGNTIDIGDLDDSNASWEKYFSNEHRITIDYEVTVPKGTDLHLNSGSGTLSIENTRGPVRGRTGSGNITASYAWKNSRLATGSGTVRISNATGILRLEAGSGDVFVKDSVLSDLQVGTGSGNIQIASVKGHLRAEAGSGNITVKGTPLTHWQVETDSGNIDLTLTASSKFRLEARSDAGSIKCDLPLTLVGKRGRRHLYGTLNGGGPTVRVEAVSGDIVVR